MVLKVFIICPSPIWINKTKNTQIYGCLLWRHQNQQLSAGRSPIYKSKQMIFIRRAGLRRKYTKHLARSFKFTEIIREHTHSLIEKKTILKLKLKWLFEHVLICFGQQFFYVHVSNYIQFFLFVFFLNTQKKSVYLLWIT